MVSTQATPKPGDLRKLRAHAELSQQALAVAAGCSLAYVRLLEAGYEPRDSEVLPRILQALNDAGQASHLAGSRIADHGGDHESG
jgi:predicted transcriptional regulator